jgi:hypothetical protein
MEQDKKQNIRNTSMICSDNTGRNYCLCCGCSWETKRRWLYWPIKLGWRNDNIGKQWWGVIWGWQIGADRMSQPVFGWTIRIWRLLIKFGDMKAKTKCRYDNEYGIWIDNRLKERKSADPS